MILTFDGPQKDYPSTAGETQEEHLVNLSPEDKEKALIYIKNRMNDMDEAIIRMSHAVEFMRSIQEGHPIIDPLEADVRELKEKRARFADAASLLSKG